jgi:hypothetical protein
MPRAMWCTAHSEQRIVGARRGALRVGYSPRWVDAGSCAPLWGLALPVQRPCGRPRITEVVPFRRILRVRFSDLATRLAGRSVRRCGRLRAVDLSTSTNLDLWP